MTLSGYFTSKSVFDQQGCRAFTFALARLSCFSLCAVGRLSLGLSFSYYLHIQLKYPVWNIWKVGYRYPY